LGFVAGLFCGTAAMMPDDQSVIACVEAQLHA